MTTPIRRLDEGDWQTYRAVRLAALRDAPAAFTSTYADAMDFTEHDWRHGLSLPCWVAGPGHTPTGMVRVGRLEAVEPELISMWVAPIARGTPMAADLVDAVLEWARGQGRAGVRLRVVVDNDRARSFYRRCGFCPDGTTHTLPDGRAEIGMSYRF